MLPQQWNLWLALYQSASPGLSRVTVKMKYRHPPCLLQIMSSLSHLHYVVWYNQIHFEWVWSEYIERQSFINWLLFKKNFFGAFLVGIPFAQSVQEAAGITQRRRASLELLQKSKYKTKFKYPHSRLHTSPKNPPPHTDKQQNLPSKESIKYTCEVHTQ